MDAAGHLKFWSPGSACTRREAMAQGLQDPRYVGGPLDSGGDDFYPISPAHHNSFYNCVCKVALGVLRYS